MACETFIAWDWNPRDPGNGLHNSSLSLGWGHISQGCSQPIMAQAKRVFLGDIGLWQWLAWVQKYPENLAGTLDCKVVEYVFIPLYSLSLSLQVSCAVVRQLSQIFPSPSSFLLTTLSLLKNPLYLILSWQLFLRGSGQVVSYPLTTPEWRTVYPGEHF